MRYGIVIASIAAVTFLGLCCGKRCGCSGNEVPGGVSSPAGRALEARVSLNAGSYAMRESIVMTLVVKNATEETSNLVFPTAQRYDFVVKKGKETVWQWGRGMMFAQVRGEHSIAAGDSIAYEVTWDQKDGGGAELGLGEYTVQGILKASPEVASEKKTFWIAD